MVRRRTCPNGVDGRKQRVARTSVRAKPTENAPVVATLVTTSSPSTEEDESSLEASPPPAPVKQHEDMDMADKKPKWEVDSKSKQPKREQSVKSKQAYKRELEITSLASDGDSIDVSASSSKRGRISPPVNLEPPTEEKQFFVASDMATASSPMEETTNVRLYSKDMTTTQSPGPVDERLEMAQQSLVVSQVAKKLEKFARQAYGLSTARPRRGGSGIVTPPFGTLRPPCAAASLLTYDDEYDYSDGDEDILQPPPSVGAVTDGDESALTQDDWATGAKMVTPDKQPKELVPSKVDHDTAEAITERIESCTPESRFNRDHIVAGIVASFAMHVSPVGNKELSLTMYHLLNNNCELWEDFQLYRAALRPHLGTGKNVQQPLTLKQIFTGDAILSDVVRDFKTFTVGCLGRILGQNGDIGIANQLLEEDREVLGSRANVWRMAVNIAV
jgi:hypothetical protein